jgi:hypothetical protein
MRACGWIVGSVAGAGELAAQQLGQRAARSARAADQASTWRSLTDRMAACSASRRLLSPTSRCS